MGGGRPGISGDRDPQRKTAGRGRMCSPLVSHSRCAAWRCESGIADVCLCAVPFVQVVRVLGIYDLPQTHAQRALDVCVTPIFVLYICGVSRKRWGVSCVCVCVFRVLARVLVVTNAHFVITLCSPQAQQRRQRILLVSASCNHRSCVHLCATSTRGIRMRGAAGGPEGHCAAAFFYAARGQSGGPRHGAASVRRGLPRQHSGGA